MLWRVDEQTLTPVPSACPGNLSPEHQKALREMYRRLFDLYGQNEVSMAESGMHQDRVKC